MQVCLIINFYRIPRVIICGKTEENIPKIVVADSQPKNKETKCSEKQISPKSIHFNISQECPKNQSCFSIPKKSKKKSCCSNFPDEDVETDCDEK